ncbi:FprA family A-type flavoprotein [Desulfotomaculum copahuensis]|uniref:MBL fold metallo-hydrolase n=1 Tax=Desulfotomaculum copahuensis TaxID=1838280 RepID=A0A1B7LGI2_9FIRM|nr:flavodoxin domain-containing protein [Desulfotomaculum copahuensis]OAT85211.1 MBL fold metallo-hydrolase [Desulfotomaculum copahuensis]
MPAVEILKDVYWVGAVDWNIRYFHGPAYSTHRGTTYNAYLIRDEKTALVDTVYKPFTGELVRNIEEIVPPGDIDYVVVNHIESDHSGAFPEIMKLAPRAKVFCTQKAADGLRKLYFGDWDFNIVKTGDRLSLGRRTLTFIEAPMLHWPDSMFTYVPEEALLLPNDAFGQHLASTFRFEDQVDGSMLMEEAAKYYANILYPFSSLVLKKLEQVREMGIEIKMIAPSHGMIWRRDPGKIVAAYLKWAGGEADPKVVIAYDTMWQSTEKMAHAILQGIAAAGVEAKLFKMSVSDRNDVIKELLNARAILVGSPTINREFLPTLAPLLDDLRGLKPTKKIGLAFGSYGWGGGAVKAIEERLKGAGVELIEPGLGINWAPTEAVLEQCVALGRRVAEAVNAR